MSDLSELTEDDIFYGTLHGQLARARSSLRELADRGEVSITVDGRPIDISLVKVVPHPTDADAPPTMSLVTIYDAVSKAYEGATSVKLEHPPAKAFFSKYRNPVPVLCHQTHMTPVAVCRVCLVEVEGQAKLTPACQRPVEAGMKIRTIETSPRVRDSVRVLTDLLRGECPTPNNPARGFATSDLDLLASAHGIETGRFSPSSKFELPRNVQREQDDSSLVISVDHTACILCDRCVRACGEVRDNHIIGRMNKGYASRIAFDADQRMGESDCVECGECMVSCPTGALAYRISVEPEIFREDIQQGKAKVVPAEDLAHHELFAGVSQNFLEWTEGSAVRRSFRKGDVVCREGESGSTAFLIEKGSFEVYISSPIASVKKKGAFGWLGRLTTEFVDFFGKSTSESPSRTSVITDTIVPLEYDPASKRLVATLTRADVLFGEMTCMSHHPRSATVVAASDGEIIEVQRNVLTVVQRNPITRERIRKVYAERSIDTYLRQVPAFQEFAKSPDDFARLVEYLKQRVRLVRLSPGQMLFRQDDPADHFYMIRLGFVKVAQRYQRGEQVLAYLGPGRYFGEIGLLGEIPEVHARLGFASGRRIASCSALDHVDLVQIRGEDFRHLIEEFPAARRALTHEAIARLEANERERQRVEGASLSDFVEQGLYQAQCLLVLDLERCTRCDECTKACADTHDGITRLIREGLRFDKYLVASSCRSCMDPYCMVGCPVDAIHRGNSKEIQIEPWCIGCGKCAENCPYGNINMHYLSDKELISRQIPIVTDEWIRPRKATTCDLCESIDGQPSCVYACPHDAAHRMSGEQLKQIVHRSNAL